jgi:hypothetical protein
MSVSVNTTFLRTLGSALQEWAEEVAMNADPELIGMPLLWMMDRREIRGCPPSSCPQAEASARLARWARALRLESQERPGTGKVFYVGQVDLWPVRLG